jgi:hypothetical protein
LHIGLGQLNVANVNKTKFIIFHTKGNMVDLGFSLIYDDNERSQNNPDLIQTIECYYKSHPAK